MSRLTALDIYIWTFDILRAVFLINGIVGAIILGAWLGISGFGIIGSIVAIFICAAVSIIFAAICDELASNAEQWKSLEIEYNNRSGR